MNAEDKVAKVKKLGKYEISITFPEGTKGQVAELVNVQDLLKVLESGDVLKGQSPFRLEKPEPSKP